MTLVLTEAELNDLAVLTIHVDYRSRRGGSAEITSKQKRSLTRCRWRTHPLRGLCRSDLAARAFGWLLKTNDTYREWVDRHAALFQGTGELGTSNRELQTAELLLRSPGIEVAVRPWLYPVASLADTDCHERLTPLGWMTSKNKPSVRTGFLRKLESRCLDYSADFPLQCLLYDICMAKTISSVQAIADKQKVAPEQIASDIDGFDVYWHQQLRKMEDICRQEYEETLSLDTALPSVFFTVAPAEWRYLLHNGIFHPGPLSDQQQSITLHLYHTLQVMLEHTDKDECHYPPDLLHEKIRRASFDAAEGCKYLRAVLCLDRFQLYRKDPLVFHPNVGELLAMMETDLILRGLTADRIATFKARIHALTLLLCAFRDGRQDPALWTVRSVSAPPRRVWSKEQQQVLEHVQRGTTISDAGEMETALGFCRLLVVRALGRRRSLSLLFDKLSRMVAVSSSLVLLGFWYPCTACDCQTYRI